MKFKVCKHVIVHLEFYSKSDHKMLSYGHFKIIAQGVLIGLYVYICQFVMR